MKLLSSLLFTLVFLTSTVSAGPVPVSVRVESSWESFPYLNSTQTTGLGRYITAMAMDSRHRLYVANMHVVWVLTPGFEIMAVIGNTEDATIRISMGTPRDVAVDSKDRVYICDSEHDTIHVLDADLAYLGCIGVEGAAPTEFPGRPWSLTVDSQDRLIVGDYRTVGQTRVLIFEPRDPPILLEYVGSFVCSNQGRYGGCGIPYDITTNDQGMILVADVENLDTVDLRHGIHVFNDTGDWVSSILTIGRCSTLFVVVGPNNTVVLSSTHLLCLYLDYAYVGYANVEVQALLVEDERILAGSMSGGIVELSPDWAALYEADLPFLVTMLILASVSCCRYFHSWRGVNQRRELNHDARKGLYR